MELGALEELETRSMSRDPARVPCRLLRTLCRQFFGRLPEEQTRDGFAGRCGRAGGGREAEWVGDLSGITEGTEGKL